MLIVFLVSLFMNFIILCVYRFVLLLLLSLLHRLNEKPFRCVTHFICVNIEKIQKTREKKKKDRTNGVRIYIHIYVTWLTDMLHCVSYNSWCKLIVTISNVCVLMKRFVLIFFFLSFFILSVPMLFFSSMYVCVYIYFYRFPFSTSHIHNEMAFAFFFLVRRMDERERDTSNERKIHQQNLYSKLHSFKKNAQCV